MKNSFAYHPLNLYLLLPLNIFHQGVLINTTYSISLSTFYIAKSSSLTLSQAILSLFLIKLIPFISQPLLLYDEISLLIHTSPVSRLVCSSTQTAGVVLVQALRWTFHIDLYDGNVTLSSLRRSRFLFPFFSFSLYSL